MTDAYAKFLERKVESAPLRGIRDVPALNAAMMPHQRASTEFLLRAGCGAAFLDTGLGKTLIELEWARCVSEHERKPVLMLAPLAVSHQHKREAEKFGIAAHIAKTADDVGEGICITNYERLHHFRPEQFGGIVLDESSIIKSFTGKTTRALMAFAESLPFRLAATATPAPNDHMELGQHSQFLGLMASNEMLARWFIADQTEMGRYRLKKHGVCSFWSWVASWSRCLSKPSDLGYSDEGFALPPLNVHHHIVRADITQNTDGLLFRMPDTSATAIHKEKRLTAAARADKIAELVNADRDQWVVWCDTDYEADALTARIADAVEVRGSMKPETKEERLAAFTDGGIRVLISKPSICGFGLNWQRCHKTAFVGLSFSYEQFYQAIRRFWRFGQTHAVECHIAMAETEEAIWLAVRRKQEDHERMKVEMYAAMRRAIEVRGVKNNYQPTAAANMPTWLRSAA